MKKIFFTYLITISICSAELIHPADLPEYNIGPDFRNPFEREAVVVQIKSNDNSEINEQIRSFFSEGATRIEDSNIQSIVHATDQYDGMIAIHGRVFKPGDYIEFDGFLQSTRPVENAHIRLSNIGPDSFVVDVFRTVIDKNKDKKASNSISGESYALSIELPEFFSGRVLKTSK